MKRFVFKLLPIAGMLITWGSAHAAVSCTIAATSLTGIAFDPASALQRTGTVSGNCTLTGGDVTPMVQVTAYAEPHVMSIPAIGNNLKTNRFIESLQNI